MPKHRRKTRPRKRWGQWTEQRHLRPHPVYYVRDAAGRQGVLKEPPGPKPWQVKRFRAEGTHLHGLSGRAGVVPVIDIDPSPEPNWFVMPRYTPIAEHLGQTPGLWEVVEYVEKLAGILVDLQADGISHRDIKPDNILIHESEPVLSDFELATWADREPLTQVGHKVGAAYFIAPEMRRFSPSADPALADVYSLAKTLFVLARPKDGPYPPDGTHRSDDPTFSLYWHGGRASADLELVLEAATAYLPNERSSMSHFRDELGRWLELYPRGAVTAPTRGRFRTAGDPEVRADIRRRQARRDRLLKQLHGAGRSIGHGSGGVLVFEGGTFSDHLQGDYGLEDHGEVDDAVLLVSGWLWTGRRAAIAYVVWGDDITLIGEVHDRAGAVKTATVAEANLREELRISLILKQLVDELVPALAGT